MGPERQIRPETGSEVLASLLDGQLSDHRHAEQLYGLLAQDAPLKAEYETQREVKALLSQLPEFQEPQYMSTRVLAGIKAQKDLRRGAFARNLRLASGGALLFALGVGTTLQFYPLGEQGARQPMLQAEALPAPGLFVSTDSEFQTLPVSVDGQLPEDMDPLLRQFLELGQEAHNHRQMLVTRDAVSPDMSSAVLVLDTGDN